MKLSIIIVNYNVKYFLSQCLNSVLKAVAKIDAEIIVVDNHSVDGSQQHIKDNYTSINLIESNENLGFSKGNNLGINQAKGQYILLLNPDTVVEETTFEKCIQFMDSHPESGGLGVKMVDGKGAFLPESKRALPTPKAAFYKIFGLSNLFPKSKTFSKYHLGYLDENKIHEVDILSGAFMLIRKKTLDKIGLLDETFFMYGEDIDLSYRIQLGGYKNYYFPNTSIIHYKGESTKKSSVNYVLVFYKAMVIFAEKHFSKKNAKTFSFLINMAIYLRAVLAVIARFLEKFALFSADFIGIIIGLIILKNEYANWTGIDYSYSLVLTAFNIYSAVFVLFIFYNGGYDQPISLLKNNKGVLFASVTALLIYSLIDENFRFSRALILMGFVWSFIWTNLNKILLTFLFPKIFPLKKKRHLRFAIVGDEIENNRIQKLLKNIGVQADFIAPIAPFELKKQNPFFVSYLNRLDEVIRIFNISDVIFSSKNVSTTQIISKMGTLNQPHLNFKIAPAESYFLIGSNSIHTSGDYHSLVEINTINSSSNQRNKRLFDVLSSILFLCFYPVLLIFITSPLTFLKNIGQVIINKKTWVGYNSQKLQPLLPKIKTGVISTANIKNISSSKTENNDVLYAKNYSVITDMKLVFLNIKKLGN